jgi:long-chain acyl-CoA synthetase
MADVRPTFVASVPRIIEKVHARVVGQATNQDGVKGKLDRWAFGHGDRASKLSQEGKSASGLAWNLSQSLVFKKVGDKLSGLFGGRLRFFISGGAPLSKDIAYFFKHAGVQICEGYGLTETSAGSTVNLPGGVRIGSVGKAFPGTEIKIEEDGEILLRGRGVFKGYWENKEATDAALEENGWFHTGDIGELDRDGFLRITDRKKDIIVTAGGKNVAPQNLENLIKSKSPLISQVVIHGDKRKFLSAIVTLDPASLQDYAKGLGIGDHNNLTQHPKIYEAINRTMDDVNAELARYESIKKFRILDHDFEIGDQLTPTLKVKRKLVNERYKDVFDEFYGSAAAA